MRRLAIIALLLAASVVFAGPTAREPEREIIPEPPAIKMEGLIMQKKHVDQDDPANAPKPIPRRPAPPEPEIWREDVPLRPELQEILLEESAAAGIDPLIIVGLIETESGFKEDAVSPTGDYGLCQLNRHYFDPNMTPEENLRAGIALLGSHLQRYGTIEAALTAYHIGHDNGTRTYASIVIGKARGWGYQS